MKHLLQHSTPLIIKAYHKKTHKSFETRMTYGEWLRFEKNDAYNYKALQVL